MKEKNKKREQFQSEVSIDSKIPSLKEISPEMLHYISGGAASPMYGFDKVGPEYNKHDYWKVDFPGGPYG